MREVIHCGECTAGIVVAAAAGMGEESTINEFEKGNTDPLHDTRKSSTAETVDERTSDVVQLPHSEAELPKNDTEERR
jgi:hypothetical protein